MNNNNLCSCENPSHEESQCFQISTILAEIPLWNGEKVKYPYCLECVQKCLTMDVRLVGMKEER